MTTPPFSGNDFRDQIDSVARNLTGNAFRLKQNDPDAPLKFMDFVAQSENEFMQVQPQAAQPTAATGIAAIQAEAERRIADPSQQLAPFSPDVGQTPASPDSPLVRALTPTRPLIDRDVAERAGRGLPLVGDVTGPVFGAASELTSPLEAVLIAASAGLGAPLAGAARGIPAVGRFIAPLLEPVSGGFGRAAAAEAAAGTGAILGSEQAAEALQDAPAPIRIAGTIAGGLAGGAGGFAAPSVAGRGARAAGEAAANVGAAAERAGIPSPVGVADAAFDLSDLSPREVRRRLKRDHGFTAEGISDEQQLETLRRFEQQKANTAAAKEQTRLDVIEANRRMNEAFGTGTVDDVVVEEQRALPPPRGVARAAEDVPSAGRRRTIDELRAAGGEPDFSIQVNAPGTFGDIAPREVNASNVADIRRRLEALIDPQGRGLPHQGRVIATKIEREGFESLSRTERDIAQDVIVRNLEPGERLTAAELRTGAERIINEAQESLVALDDAVANAEADVIQRGIDRIGANEPPPASVTRGLARAADDVPDVARRRSVGDIENEIDEVDNALKIARKEVDDWTPTRERVDAGEGVLGKRFVELHPDDKSDIARLEAVRDDLQARRKNLTDELNDAFEQATPVTPARAADDVPPRLPQQAVQPPVARQADEVARLTPEQQLEADVAAARQAPPPEPPVARPITTAGEPPRQPVGASNQSINVGKQGVLLEVPPTQIGENLLDLRPIQIRELGVVDRALNSARATLGKLTNKEVVLKNKLVKAAFDEVRRVQPRITSQANLKTASISEAARVFVRDSKGRIPALAGIDPAVPGAPTIQDVAARRPRYLAYLSEEQKAALERIRFEMDDYVKARDEVGLEVSGRGDLVGAATPTESGFYLPRGGNPDSPDVPRSTRGRGGKIGAEQRSVYDSMAQAMDDGATYFPFGDAIQGFGQNMGERLANMHAANFLRRLEVETGIPLGRAGGKPLPGELGLPSGSAVPSLRELRGTTFPPEITNAVNEILATQGELIGKGSEVLKAINAYNNFYRGSRSTLDNSAIMIQGLLGSASDPQASARAMLLNTEIWKTGKAREIFGRYVADADKQADDVLGIPDFSRSAAQKGLILNGGETELTQSVITRIPGVRRAANAFGFYGDALRLSWLADEVAIEMRRTGKTGQQIVQDGTLERLAKAINPATGVTEGNRLTDIASIASFAPRFLQSRLLTVARGIRGLDVDAPLDILPSSVRSRVPLPATPLNRAARLEDRIARKALIRLIGYGTAITVGANAAQGEETDFRLFVNGRLNPNFMRIRFGERDFSVFGTWDSIAKLIIGTGQGISQGNVKTILGSARGLGSGITTQAWDLLSGRDFEGRETRTNPQTFAAHITRSHLPFQAEELPAASGKIVEGVREGDIGQAATGVAQIALEGHGAKSSPLSGGDQLDIATKEGNFSSDSFGDLEPFERNEVRDQVGDVFRDRGTPQDIFFDGIDQIEHREPGTLGVSDVGGREPRRERLLAQAGTLTNREIIDEWFSIESDAAAERNGLRLGTGVEFDPEQDDNEKLLERWYAIFGIPSVRDKLGRARFTELDKQRKSFLAELSPKQREFLLRNTHLRPVDPQMLVILKNAGAQGTVKNIQDSEIARERFRANLQNSDIGDGSPVAPVQPRFPQAPNFGSQPVLPLGDR